VKNLITQDGGQDAKLEKGTEKCESLQRDVGDAIHDIRIGVGIDFRERLRSLI
jgi:hypothetical protein